MSIDVAVQDTPEGIPGSAASSCAVPVGLDVAVVEPSVLLGGVDVAVPLPVGSEVWLGPDVPDPGLVAPVVPDATTPLPAVSARHGWTSTRVTATATTSATAMPAKRGRRASLPASWGVAGLVVGEFAGGGFGDGCHAGGDGLEAVGVPVFGGEVGGGGAHGGHGSGGSVVGWVVGVAGGDEGRAEGDGVFGVGVDGGREGGVRGAHRSATMGMREDPPTSSTVAASWWG